MKTARIYKRRLPPINKYIYKCYTHSGIGARSSVPSGIRNPFGRLCMFACGLNTPTKSTRHCCSAAGARWKEADEESHEHRRQKDQELGEHCHLVVPLAERPARVLVDWLSRCEQTNSQEFQCRQKQLEIRNPEPQLDLNDWITGNAQLNKRKCR